MTQHQNNSENSIFGIVVGHPAWSGAVAVILPTLLAIIYFLLDGEYRKAQITFFTAGLLILAVIFFLLASNVQEKRIKWICFAIAMIALSLIIPIVFPLLTTSQSPVATEILQPTTVLTEIPTPCPTPVTAQCFNNYYDNP